MLLGYRAKCVLANSVDPDQAQSDQGVHCFAVALFMMHQTDEDRLANKIDSDQTAPLSLYG